MSYVTISKEHYKKLVHYADLEEHGRLIKTPETGIGDLSDGYHTFNELYHHRAILFSVICNSFKSCAWKSKKHSDGTMYDGMFIVGIDTPEGSATYHYDIESYWNMFDVKELDKAPEWDGHTPDDAISRIAGLSKSNRLIELSCKVGDTVWLLNLDKIEECVVDSFHIYDMRDIYVTLTTIKYNDKEEHWYEEDIDKSCTRFGIDTFLTKEEAEAKLKELQGNDKIKDCE